MKSSTKKYNETFTIKTLKGDQKIYKKISNKNEFIHLLRYYSDKDIKN